MNGARQQQRTTKQIRFAAWILPEFIAVERALMNRPLAEVLAAEVAMMVSEERATVRPVAS